MLNFLFLSLIPPILLITVDLIIIINGIKESKKEDNTPIDDNQTNKVVNVTLIGGIIGMFVVSPQNSLNNRIKKENAKGWRVVQIIPATSGNIFLFIFRLFILLITFFLFTYANGYYIIMEKK